MVDSGQEVLRPRSEWSSSLPRLAPGLLTCPRIRPRPSRRMRAPSQTRLWKRLFGPGPTILLLHASFPMNMVTSSQLRDPLRPFAFALDYRDVAVDWQVGESFYCTTGLRPFYFQRVNPRSFANAEHYTRIMRGQETAPSNFRSASFQVRGLICDARTHAVRIRFFPHELHSQPMVLISYVVSQQNWGGVINSYQDIDPTVVVEVSNGHSTG